MASGEDEEDRRRYLREIGLAVVQTRLDRLEHKAERVKVRGRVARPDTSCEQVSLLPPCITPSSPSSESLRHASSSKSTSARTPSPALLPLQLEMQEAKLEQNENRKKFQKELMREHQVILDREGRMVQKMPDANLCISQGMKNSVLKMRRNLLQRRMNVMVFEKKVNEWSMPALRAKVRRQRAATVQAGASLVVLSPNSVAAVSPLVVGVSEEG